MIAVPGMVATCLITGNPVGFIYLDIFLFVDLMQMQNAKCFGHT